VKHAQKGEKILKIYRLVTQKNKLNYNEAKTLISRLSKKIKEKDNDLLIVTPGGFIYDFFPEKLIIKVGWESQKEEFPKLIEFAEKLLFQKFLTKDIRKTLKETSKIITLGFDLNGEEEEAELVAVYDTRKEKILKWTGKSYPTSSQEDKLFHIKEVETHFFEYDKERILILGCHDLNIFSPRSKANRSATSSRGKLCSDFISRTKNFNPTIVIQHPHTTDSSRIWSQGWSGIRQLFPKLKQYCSGICYYYHNYEERSPIESVLKSTKNENVIDIVL
jgi:hypothetical protein